MGDSTSTNAMRNALENTYMLQQRFNEKVKEMSPE
jgi:hypothetical protein